METMNASAFRHGRAAFRCSILSAVAVAMVFLRPMPASAGPSPWTLIAGSGASGGGALLMQVADIDSDPRIAGLTFRCNDNRIDTLVVLVEPVPPRTHVTVALRVGTASQSFEASIIPTGAGLVVPFDPHVSLATVWSGQKQLHVAIDVDGTSFSAFLDLTGLAPALSGLTSACVR